MRSKTLFVALLVLLGLSPAFAWADSAAGTIVVMDSANNRITIKDKVKGTNRSFTISRTAQVSLDGDKVLTGQLEVGQQVTVIYAGTTASRLIAKKGESEAAKPMPTPAETPKPAATSPDPKPVTTPAPAPRTPPTRTPANNSGTRPAARNSQPAATAEGGDWGQYRGPNRDDISRETGLLKEWPEDGPKQAWRVNGLGEGYSTVAVADGRVITMGNQGDDEMVTALDIQSGDKLWSTRTGRGYRDGTGNGPRGTPTIDGDTVYVLGANGDLAALETSNGNKKWNLNILETFGGRNIQWGISESVLIDGDKLICTPGGRDATMVALNKNTGRPIWRAPVPSNPQASYSSAIAIDVGGVRQYVNFTSAGVVGVRASDGNAMWGQRESANPTANCSSPMFHNGMLFTASGYGTGGAMFRLQSRGGQTGSQLGYRTDEMKNHHGGMVLIDGHIYGSNDPGILTCIDLATGNVKWKNRSVGKGSLTVADGHIYMRSEEGPVALVEVNSSRYVEKGRFEQRDRSGRPTWAHPVVARGKLFLRDMDRLLVYSVKAE